MKLDKAIEILANYPITYPELWEATKLAIEAIKLVEKIRSEHPGWHCSHCTTFLQGETEE